MPVCPKGCDVTEECTPTKISVHVYDKLGTALISASTRVF